MQLSIRGSVSANSYAAVSGVTIEAIEWWPYDDETGNNPIWEADDGSFLGW